MKKTALILVLFSLYMNAQISFPSYEKLWKEVEKLETDNLTKSANEKVEKIYQTAKKEQNHPQVIKALLHQSKYAMTLEEDAQLNIVKRMEKEISESSFPAKNILESILGNLYWQYFQQNRWEFYNRTETAEKVNPDDFRTWDLPTLFRETENHFDRSLEAKNLLQQIDSKAFDAILTEGKDDAIYRPTMYDFLVHQALDFYQTDEKNLTKPAYKFELDNPAYLAPLSEFLTLNIQTKDSLSTQFKALQLYQNLLSFHLKEAQPDALILADIERLNFIYEFSTLPEKQNLLIETLTAAVKKYDNVPVGTLYDAELAKIYVTQGNEYALPTNTTHQWELKKALELSNEALSKFPESIGAKKCLALKNEILQPNLSLTSVEMIPENQYSPLLVSYKNIDKIYFKILKTDFKQIQVFSQTYDSAELLDLFKNLTTVENWNQSLKNTGDYQIHSTESVIPRLKQGFYVVLASPDADFKEKFAYTVIQITDLALTDWNGNKQHRLQLLDRNNGKPIAGASVDVFNKTENRYDKPFKQTFKTDKEGFISLPKDTYYSNLYASVTTGGKKGIFGNYYINQRYDNHENTDTFYEVFLFTDRSIYRPGQKVYFKGIVLERKPEGKKIVSQVAVNENVTITLKDANWQDVNKLELKTNAFGSVAGEFTLPENVLTGNFQLELKGKNDKISGYDEFSVEEYKRPKFETTFKPVTETFKVNESVTVNGLATAYAGSAITDAKVVYRVHRNVHYPHWYYWRMPYYYAEPQEITHGETTTNDKGEFTVTFTALPDKSVDSANLPLFEYQITADVTDQNGETRTGNTTVKVGYHSILLKINTSETWQVSDNEQKITISTLNLNDEKIAVNGTVKIFKLKAPDNLLIKRPWEAPDLQTWDKQTFNQMFPHTPYQNEDKAENWELGKMVYHRDFTSTTDTDVNLVLKKEYADWETGKYQIVAEITDKNGKKITEKTLVDLQNSKDKKVADRQFLQVSTDKTTYLPGEKVLVKVGSASSDATVIVSVEKNQQIVKTHLVALNNEIKTLEIPVTADDWGGFVIHYSLANYNDFQSETIAVKVEETIHPLQIETGTFTDKMQPGSEQKWYFTLKGLQKDQKTAELLASMYDTSLDQFKPHQWQKPEISLYNPYWSGINIQANNSFRNTYFQTYHISLPYSEEPENLQFSGLNWFGFQFGEFYNYHSIGYGRNNLKALSKRKGEEVEMMVMEDSAEKPALQEVVASAPHAEFDKDTKGHPAGNYADPDDTWDKKSEKPKTDFSDVKVRTNFNETAFFYPQLTTDAEGNVSFSFTSPEALTRWKLQLVGHTTDMKTAYLTANAVTQKDLMLLPNPPRFLREGDQIIFSTKISNLSDKTLNGTAVLELTDPVTGKNIDTKLTDGNLQQNFTVGSKGNTSVSWTLKVPFDVQAVQYKIRAKADNFSDGEQNALPVLSNRMLVTETLPMWINSNETKTFTLDKLKNNTSTSLQNHKLTLEVTSNPVWYAIQALPYLLEYPYECSEQTFSRYYANALATKIVDDNPKIKKVFEQWENTDALLSNLEKNEELKSVLIAETPWLRDAQSETEQKKRIALLFDLKKMTKELEKNAQKLRDMQFPDGGFPWFKGAYYPDRYMTQHITAGFGHLKKLGAYPVSNSLFKAGENDKNEQMLIKAVQFLDEKIAEDYAEIQKQAQIIREKAKNKAEGEKKAKEYLESNHLGALQLHYLYTRTFYPEVSQNSAVQKAKNYFIHQAYKYWKEYTLYQKGLIALVAKRNQKTDIAELIVKSLDENSITHQELGMYWKENKASWWWHQAPVETQALMIETFAEVKPVQKQIDMLKVWLLKNKQTNRWETTKATTEAIYGLLAYGTDWTKTNELVQIKVANQAVTPKKDEAEAGTGYFKTDWRADQITPDKATVTLTNTNNGIAWGGLYWQYFENLDKITFATTPLGISKKLFLKKNEDTGEKLYEITESSTLKVGDLVRVRIEIKVDRDMEFVHLKDMRASGFEPINVLSTYKYQDNLGYYESTKDVATNFFFSYLPKGIYVFEYDLRANNVGDFSNGITTMQCMYAPEFTSHSEGVRVKIEK